MNAIWSNRRRGRPTRERLPLSEEFPGPGPDASVGRRWKFRRNLIICLASKHGASQRLLADVFDLQPSRIHAIIKQFREHSCEHSGEQEQEP